MKKHLLLTSILSAVLLPVQAANDADNNIGILRQHPPLQEQPAAPAQAAPQQPAQTALQQPAEAAPQQPAQTAPQQPAEAAPQQPAQTAAPQQPAQAAPQQPAQTAPQQPAEAAPQQPAPTTAAPTVTMGNDTADDSIAARIAAGKQQAAQQQQQAAFAADAGVAAQLNQAGDKLLRQMNEAQQTNPVVSGIGAALLLEAVSDGAVGSSKDEITAWLGVAGQAPIRMNTALQLHDAALQQAAAMLIPNTDDILPAYREHLHKAGFITAPDLATLNTSVAQVTQQKIPAVLDHLDPDARLVLVHALHFAAPWQQPFNADNTAPQPFHIAAGKKGRTSTVSVPTMQGSPRAGLIQDEAAHITAVALPFAHDYTLLIAMPQGNADKASLQQAEAWLGTHRQALLAAAPHKIKLRLPKWQLQRNAALIPLLTADGIRTIFGDQADLSNIGPGLFVKEFKQDINLAIDEAGGEAAVATTAVVANRSMSIDPVPDIRIDRPFVYAVVHKNSGIDILKGYLHNPVATADKASLSTPAATPAPAAPAAGRVVGTMKNKTAKKAKKTKRGGRK